MINGGSDNKALEDYYNYIISEIAKKEVYVNIWSVDNTRELIRMLNYMRGKGLTCDKGEPVDGFYHIKIWIE